MQQKQTIEFATVVKDGVVQKVGKSTMLQPKPNFKGGYIKWYQDKVKARGHKPTSRNPLP